MELRTMETLKKYTSTIDGINEWTGRLFCWIMLPLVGITIYEVVARKFFNSPTIWVFESSNQLYGLHFMMGSAYALLRGSHVSVDVFYRYLSPKGKAIIDIIGFLIFFFPFCVVILWKGIQFAGQAWAMREVSQSVFHPPLYPIKTVIPIMGTLLLLQGSTIFIKRLFFVTTGKEMGR
jgi:TRAP-type mannitol/chloroaromatic compound transport system permease small subunit